MCPIPEHYYKLYNDDKEYGFYYLNQFDNVDFKKIQSITISNYQCSEELQLILNQCTKLESLYICETEVHGKLDLSVLKELKTLCIGELDTDNNISEFNIDQCYNIINLDISYNYNPNITTIKYNNLVLLEKLDISNNEIEHLPDLTKCTNLTSLKCSSNKLTELSILESNTFNNLVYLDICNNVIDKKPNLTIFPSLTYLDIINNPFYNDIKDKNINPTDKFGSEKNYSKKILSIYDKNFDYERSIVYKLYNDNKLYSFKKLEEIPASVLENIVYLNIYNYKFKPFDCQKIISKCEKLETLKLISVFIDKSDFLFNYKYLKTLYLKGSSIHKRFFDNYSFENLEVLKLSRFQFHNFDSIDFTKLEDLIVLYINSCRISNSDYLNISLLSNLEELYIYNNSLTNIPLLNQWNKLELLKLLDISHNYFITLPKLHTFPNLEKLLCYDNMFYELPPNKIYNINVVY